MVGEVVGLGQAQAQGGGALLSAGGEVGGRPAVEIDEQVVSVGTDGGGAAGQVAGFRLAQGLRVSGLVGEAQRLGRIVGRAQSKVSAEAKSERARAGLGARLPDWLGGGLEQLVPLLQLGVEGAALGDALEQGVALRQCALVAAEIGRVGALPLSDGDIEVASRRDEEPVSRSRSRVVNWTARIAPRAWAARRVTPLTRIRLLVRGAPDRCRAALAALAAPAARAASAISTSSDSALTRASPATRMTWGWSASQRISSPSVWARVERREASM